MTNHQVNVSKYISFILISISITGCEGVSNLQFNGNVNNFRYFSPVNFNPSGTWLCQNIAQEYFIGQIIYTPHEERRRIIDQNTGEGKVETTITGYSMSGEIRETNMGKQSKDGGFRTFHNNSSNQFKPKSTNWPLNTWFIKIDTSFKLISKWEDKSNIVMINLHDHKTIFLYTKINLNHLEQVAENEMYRIRLKRDGLLPHAIFLEEEHLSDYLRKYSQAGFETNGKSLFVCARQ